MPQLVRMARGVYHVRVAVVDMRAALHGRRAFDLVAERGIGVQLCFHAGLLINTQRGCR